MIKIVYYRTEGNLKSDKRFVFNTFFCNIKLFNHTV